jgi:drug/metabolite transporter (DMT)-like permease
VTAAAPATPVVSPASPTTTAKATSHEPSVWIWAFGYFAAYAPYSALTKALTSGYLRGVPRVSGTSMLPISVLASALVMYALFSGLGWWKHATQLRVGNLSLPVPRRATLVSGLCTSAIVVTTTLAYTLDGISIVFAMLLMRGGVLVIAPFVDLLAKRHVRWFSWLALGLSVASLFAAFAGDGGLAITVVAAVDIGVYLLSYFVKLRLMSGVAKSTDVQTNRRYFVEEQMVATPMAVLALALMAAAGQHELREGFLSLWTHPAMPYIVVVGVLSQGTGVFGGLVLLAPQENTYCVPVNRASSVLAGIVASVGLAVLWQKPLPSASEWVGAGLILAAILALSVPPLLQKPKAKPAA